MDATKLKQLADIANQTRAQGNPAQQQATQPQPQQGNVLYNIGRSIAHPFAEFGTALSQIPKAIAGEIASGSGDAKRRQAGIDMIKEAQMRAFGTNKEGEIGKKIISDVGQIGLTVAAPGGGSIARGAKVGAAFGGLSALGENDSNLGTVAKGAALGGVTGGAISGGSKLLGKIARGTSGALEKSSEKVAQNKLMESLAKDAEPYAGIAKNQREKLNMASTLDFFKNKLGLGTDPESLGKTASLVTGPNGAASSTMRGILRDVGTVDVTGATTGKSGFLEAARQAISDEPLLGSVSQKGSQANDLFGFMSRIEQGKIFEDVGSLTGTGNANNVFDAIQYLEKQIDRYRESEAGTVGDAIGIVMKKTKRFLEDKLYNDAGVNDAVKNFKLSPEDMMYIRENVAKNGGSDSLATHIIQGINNAKTGQELRGLQAPFVQASKLADYAGRASEGYIPKATGGTSNDLFNYPALSGAASVLGGNPAGGVRLLGNRYVREGVTNLGQKVAGGVGNLAEAGGVNTKDAISRILTQGLATSEGQSTGQPQQDMQMQSLQNTPTPDTLQTGDISQQETGTSPFSQENIQAAILGDIQRTGGKNISTLVSLYNTFGKPSTQDAAAMKAQKTAQSALSKVDQLEKLYTQAGGGQSRVGGFVSSLLGKAGVGNTSAVQTYNQVRNTLAASVARAMGETGVLSDKDIARYTQALPQVTDTPQEAQRKLDYIRTILSENANVPQDDLVGAVQ